MSARPKWIGGGLFALICAFFGGPLFTTDYKDAVAHDRTYLVALGDGWHELLGIVWRIVSSTTFLWSLSIIVAFAVGVGALRLIQIVTEPTTERPLADLVYEMSGFAHTIRIHQQHGGFLFTNEGSTGLAELHAFCLTVSKRGIHLPHPVGDGEAWLKKIERIFRTIAPLIEAGHAKEARETAIALTAGAGG